MVAGEGTGALDLTQIRYFLTLARTLNFTRAAEQCNVTQPAFTRSIQRLEDELGGPLILRERAFTQLTEFGRAMLPLLQQTHDAAAAVQARAARHRRQEDAASLRLGLAPSVPFSALLPPLREVAARVEGSELTLLRREGDALAAALLAGELDVAVLPETEPLPERLNRWPLWPERLWVLAPDDHPLAARDAVDAAALDGVAVVAAEPSGTAEAALARLGVERGIRPQPPQHRGGGYPELGALVALGLGLALVPAGAPVPAGTVARPLVKPEVSHPVVLAAAAGRPMNRAVGAFVRLVRARAWEAPGSAPAA